MPSVALAPLRAAEDTEFKAHAFHVQEMVVSPPSTHQLLGTRKVLKATRVIIDGEPHETSQRFWSSLCARFGISPNIFNYFDHDEVLDRIVKRRGPDNTVVRVVVEKTVGDDGKPKSRLLGLTNPDKPYVDYYGLMNVLGEYKAISAEYHDGDVFSKHDLGHEIGLLNIGGEKYSPRLMLRTPIDGYGVPSIYLEILRHVCSNGMIAMAPAFRTDVELGKNTKGDVTDALVRMLLTYANDQGFADLRSRIEAAQRSWASINEARSLGNVLKHIAPTTTEELVNATMAGSKISKEQMDRNLEISVAFNQMVGPLVEIYGLTQLDALSDKKARALPTQAKVNDLINFSTELATHKIKKVPHKLALQIWVGSTLTREFDLEGADIKADLRSDAGFKDFLAAKVQPAKK